MKEFAFWAIGTWALWALVSNWQADRRQDFLDRCELPTPAACYKAADEAKAREAAADLAFKIARVKQDEARRAELLATPDDQLMPFDRITKLTIVYNDWLIPLGALLVTLLLPSFLQKLRPDWR